MDKTDIKILNILHNRGRITNKRLSEEIGLNPSSTLERVNKLEARGIIKGYSANIDMEKLGYNTIAFIQVSLKRHNKDNIISFLQDLEKIEELVEYYHIAGQYDYMLKVHVKTNKDLQNFLIEKITSIQLIDKTETMLVFEEKKLNVNL